MSSNHLTLHHPLLLNLSLEVYKFQRTAALPVSAVVEVHTDTQDGFFISIQPASLTLKTNQTLIPFPNSVAEAGFWRWRPSYQGVQIVLQSCLSGPKSLGNLEP